MFYRVQQNSAACRPPVRVTAADLRSNAQVARALSYCFIPLNVPSPGISKHLAAHACAIDGAGQFDGDILSSG